MKNREKIRLVAFDLDGTTLQGHAELSARNWQAIEKASEAGVWMVPATGRVKNFIPPCLTELPSIRYAITSSGGAVWDLHEDKLVCANWIPAETALAVQQIFDDYELYVEYYVNGRGVTRRDNPDKAKTVFGFPEDKFYFITKDYTFVDSLSDYLTETGAQPEKINMMFIPENVREEILARLQQLDGIELAYSKVDNIGTNSACGARRSGLIQRRRGRSATRATTSACCARRALRRWSETAFRRQRPRQMRSSRRALRTALPKRSSVLCSATNFITERFLSC